MGRLENVDGGNSSAPWEDGSSEDGTAEGDKTPVSGYAFTPLMVRSKHLRTLTENYI